MTDVPQPPAEVEILVVEDSPMQSAVLQGKLRTRGYAVRAAANGAEGLAAVRDSRPSLVISDIDMPEMDGYAMCEAIKSDRELRDLPVILLTSLNDPEDIFHGLKAKANNYLTKPYDEEVLFARIDHLLANRHLRGQRQASKGVEIQFARRRHVVDSDREQILDLLVSTFDDAVRKNNALIARTEELEESRRSLLDKTRQLEEQITERRRAEAEIQRARDEVGEANAAKTRFLAHIGLTLRASLEEVIAYTRSPVDEEARFKANAAGEHLLVLLDDIVDYAGIESGEMELVAADFEVASTVQEVVETVRPLMKRNANRLEIHASFDLGHMCADRKRVRQCLYNVLSNAAKFTHGGTVALHVAAVEREGGEWVEFKVADTGVGMDKDRLQALFHAFPQLDPEAMMRGESTGLGLALTRRLSQMMGGEIGASSRKGEGSTFILTLPRRS
jgi:two-component system, sensor histidine kinase and response regulator